MSKKGLHMINISLSDSFTNKKIISQHPDALGKSFIAAEISVVRFIRHVRDGKAWAVGTYTDDHRSKKTFIQSGVLALDLDNKGVSVANCLENAAIARYAALIHPSPTSSEDHPKTRIVFVLDRPINTREKWELAAQACLHHFEDLKPDVKCKDAARFYYGSDKGEAHERPNAVLPLDLVATWVKNYKQAQDDERAALAVAPGGDTKSEPANRAEAYADAAYTNTLNDLYNATEGSRNDMLNKSAFSMFGMARGGWPGITDSRIELDLKAAGNVLGLTSTEVAATIRSASNSATAKPLVLDSVHTPLTDYNVEQAQSVGVEHQQATLTTLQSTLRQYMALAKAGDVAGDELQRFAENVQSGVDSLLSMAGKINVVSGWDAQKQAGEAYRRTLENPQWIIGLESGLTSLDYAIGGFPGGQCYTALGAAGTGKTTLAASLIAQWAQHNKILVISCEQIAKITVMRLWAYFAQIPFGDIRRGGKLIY
ncbi:hypothetical protein LCGC14_1676010, partial [marine sediment metagenome]